MKIIESYRARRPHVLAEMRDAGAVLVINGNVPVEMHFYDAMELYLFGCEIRHAGNDLLKELRNQAERDRVVGEMRVEKVV